MNALCVALLCLASAASAAQTNSIRLLAVYSNCFDYVFASTVTSSGDRPTLAFNHIGGRTSFVKVGDKLDDYLVQSVEPRVEKVYNPTINADQSVKSGSVTLRGESGTLVLDMGKPLRLPGYLALIAWLDTGVTAYARVGTGVGTSPARVVTSIGPAGVELASPEGVVNAPPATQQERDGLADLWRRNQEEQEKARLAAAQQKQHDLAQAADQRPQAAQPAQLRAAGPTKLVDITFNPLQIVNVTPTRMPVAWAVVPVTRTVNGKQVTYYETKEFTVPMPQFDRIEYRGSVITVAQ